MRQPKERNRRPFLWFQVGMALLFAVMAALPAFERPTVDGRDLLRWVSGWTALGLLLSTGISIAFTRTSEHYLRGFRAAAILLLAALLGGVLWGTLLWLLEPLIGRDPFSPPDVTSRQYVTFNSLRGAALLGLWIALFVVSLLSSRMQRAREQSARLTAAAAEAQISLLRSQLNPHFLFNALNSVVALIGEDRRKAQTMVRDIATLLRTSLATDGAREVTVQEELDFVGLYLKCEQVRFEERLRVEFDIESGIERLKVPPMLLHPLVENAVKHGMGSANGPLAIRVAARRSATQLSFTVTNTGSLQRPSGAFLPPSHGIGLRNVRERLAQLFPERHSIELGEVEGKVVARIELPVLEGH